MHNDEIYLKEKFIVSVLK